MVIKKQNSKLNFEHFNRDLSELYDYLKSNNYNNNEIKKIFHPLINKTNTKKLNTFHIIIISLSFFILGIYLLSYFERISWHLSALGRIYLIKLLPYWDWKALKNKQCLIPLSNHQGETTFNCDLCETLLKIDKIDSIQEDQLISRYIQIDQPLILTKGLENWPANSSFLLDLLKDYNYYNSYACNLFTNTQKDVNQPIGAILTSIANFDNYFIHFQNCDVEAMKSFRSFTYRPPFLPQIYSPITYNWLLWNRNYNTTKFKSIDLIEKISVVSQITGFGDFLLLPRKNCEFECSKLNILLEKGESLILTSLWDLKYRPYAGNGNDENVAVILEARD